MSKEVNCFKVVNETDYFYTLENINGKDEIKMEKGLFYPFNVFIDDYFIIDGKEIYKGCNYPKNEPLITTPSKVACEVTYIDYDDFLKFINLLQGNPLRINSEINRELVEFLKDLQIDLDTNLLLYNTGILKNTLNKFKLFVKKAIQSGDKHEKE